MLESPFTTRRIQENLYVDGPYRRPPLWLSRLRARLYLRHIRRLVAIEQGHAVLEVGCDRGQLTELLSALSASVVGVDINPRVVHKAVA